MVCQPPLDAEMSFPFHGDERNQCWNRHTRTGEVHGTSPCFSHWKEWTRCPLGWYCVWKQSAGHTRQADSIEKHVQVSFSKKVGLFFKGFPKRDRVHIVVVKSRKVDILLSCQTVTFTVLVLFRRRVMVWPADEVAVSSFDLFYL